VIFYLPVKFGGQSRFDIPEELQGGFLRMVIDGQPLAEGSDFVREDEGTRVRLIDSCTPLAISTVIITDE
jgi:hypothetical protein